MKLVKDLEFGKNLGKDETQVIYPTVDDKFDGWLDHYALLNLKMIYFKRILSNEVKKVYLVFKKKIKELHL